MCHRVARQRENPAVVSPSRRVKKSVQPSADTNVGRSSSLVDSSKSRRGGPKSSLIDERDAVQMSGSPSRLDMNKMRSWSAETTGNPSSADELSGDSGTGVFHGVPLGGATKRSSPVAAVVAPK